MAHVAGLNDADALEEIRRLGAVGDDHAANDLASKLADTSDDSSVVGTALMLQLCGVINVGQLDAVPALLDRAFQALEGSGERAVLGSVHALAGFVFIRTSTQRCLRHLVQAWRVLMEIEQPDYEAVVAWHNLAVTYSYVGFHTQAMEAAEHGYRLTRALGLPLGQHARPEVSVRSAVALDHCGDSHECAQMLQDVLTTWAWRLPISELRVIEQHYYAYAAVRLAALGYQAPDLSHLRGGLPDGWEAEDLAMFFAACEAIVNDRATDALSILDRRQSDPCTLGAAEVFRVRSMAYAALGRHREARVADREAMRVASSATGELRDRLVDGVRMQLDHEALRRTVDQYVSDALTDPLTGLPNRREFDRRISSGCAARTTLGVIDLDNFKMINTVHGHLGGDLVLKRVAAILARTMRGGDFVARYGGDEFVTVLVDTDLRTAYELGRHISEEVAGEDWSSLVAGTPVAVTVGWAEMHDGETVAEVLAEADREMLMLKRRGSHTSPKNRL